MLQVCRRPVCLCARHALAMHSILYDSLGKWVPYICPGSMPATRCEKLNTPMSNYATTLEVCLARPSSCNLQVESVSLEFLSLWLCRPSKQALPIWRHLHAVRVLADAIYSGLPRLRDRCAEAAAPVPDAWHIPGNAEDHVQSVCQGRAEYHQADADPCSEIHH